MLELLSQNLLWWHWIVFGIALLTLEIFSGTFMMLGLGLSAIVVGAIDIFYPISTESELLVWMLLSILSIALWFKYMKDLTIETSGQSNYSLETRGSVEEEIKINQRGRVHFDAPVLGNTQWVATSKETIPVDTRIKIVEIKGQLIEVATL